MIDNHVHSRNNSSDLGEHLGTVRYALGIYYRLGFRLLVYDFAITICTVVGLEKN